MNKMNKINNIHTKIVKVIEHKNFISFMFVCILGYALFKTSNRYIGDIFQTFIVLGSALAFFIYRKIMIKDKIILCLLFSIVLSIASWLNSMFNIPELAQQSPNVGILANLFFFIMIAFWLKGSIYKVRLLWVAYAVGVLLTAALHSNDLLLDIHRGLSGSRIDFNYINANHSAALAGIMILISSYYIIKVKPITLKFVLFCFVFIPFLFIAISTQARQVWLAILIASILTPILISIINKNANVKAIVISIIIISTSLLAISKVPIIEKRIGAENNVIAMLESGDIADLPYTSIGIRIHFWLESIPWIEKHPILGLGENTRDLVIKQSENIPTNIKKEYSHLHNGHIEMLVSYGIIGLLLSLYIYYTIIKSSFIYKKSSEITIISFLFIIFFIVINIFESFLFFKTGQYMINIFFGGIYTFYLTEQLSKTENSNGK